MRCKNVFCVYEKNNHCTNENEVGIDWRGSCENMIPIRISRNTLRTEKLVTRLKIEDGEHYFDEKTGRVTINDEAYSFYDSDLELD